MSSKYTLSLRYPYQAAHSRRHTQTDTFPCRGTVLDSVFYVRGSVLWAADRNALKQMSGPLWNRWQDHCETDVRTTVKQMSGPLWNRTQDHCETDVRTTVKQMSGPLWNRCQDHCEIEHRTIRPSSTIGRIGTYWYLLVGTIGCIGTCCYFLLPVFTYCYLLVPISAYWWSRSQLHSGHTWTLLSTISTIRGEFHCIN